MMKCEICGRECSEEEIALWKSGRSRFKDQETLGIFICKRCFHEGGEDKHEVSQVRK